MLLGIEVLACLRQQSETAQSLAGVLRADQAEVQDVLKILSGEGMVSGAPSGYADPSTHVGIYSITPEGEQAYGRILDYFSSRFLGSMTVADRFLTALAEPLPIGTRMRLFELLNKVPDERHGSDRRADAVVIGRAAVECAQLALDADEGGQVAAAVGLRSLARGSAEQLGYVGQQLRCDYMDSVTDPELREVVEHAAAACEAAWDLRPVGPRDPATNTSEAHVPSPNSYSVVADEAAAALRTLARHRGLDVNTEADKVIRSLRPR